jgi:hypothetical protein
MVGLGCAGSRSKTDASEPIRLNVPVLPDLAKPGPVKVLVISGHVLSGEVEVIQRPDGVYANGIPWLVIHPSPNPRDSSIIESASLRASYLATPAIRERYWGGMPLSNAANAYYEELNHALESAAREYEARRKSTDSSTAASFAVLKLDADRLDLRQPVEQYISFSPCGGITVERRHLGSYGLLCGPHPSRGVPVPSESTLRGWMHRQIKDLRRDFRSASDMVIIYSHHGARSSYSGPSYGRRAANEVFLAAGLPGATSGDSTATGLVGAETLEQVREVARRR